MGIGFSLFLVAVGAIMRYAIEANVNGFNIHTAGMILIIVGIVGTVVSVFVEGIPGRGRMRSRRTRTIDAGDGNAVQEVEETKSVSG